ncbi:MAG: AAA family ATPase [Firmicutes bacterium]|nr:AAA family ATPase [Bacillota bacterium]
MYKKWDVDLVGVLADDEFVYSRTGGKMAVFVNRQNVVQFSIRLISQAPDSFPNVKLFTGYSTDLERYGYVEDYFADIVERAQSLREFLRDYLVVFRPFIRGEYYNIADVRLVNVPLAHHDDAAYVPLPVFSSSEHGLEFPEFMDKLSKNQFIGKIPYVSTDSTDTPTCILWRDDESLTYKVVGEFVRHRYGFGGFQFWHNQLRVLDFKPEWENDFFEVPNDPTLAFVGYEAYQAMLEQLAIQPLYIPPTESLLPELETGQTLTTSIVTLEQAEDPVNETSPEEIEFLQLLARTAREHGLLYDEADLVNFHTAMKTGGLIILSGMSGTGKTKLVQIYGRTLGMDDEQLSIIPVRPAWTDDADLLGYVDSVNMVYRPGDSGLVNTLIQANANKDRLYLVCFDEMNLARVEHYFSQFLSVLEMDPARRRLRLYNEELLPRLYNSAYYPPSISIGDNVLFVGTVNLDESTYHFSDKVLDRANVITLKVLPFAQLKGLSEERKRKQDFRPEMSLAQYHSFIADTQTITLTDRELALITQMHQLLQQASSNLGIGYRVVRQINAFMANLPATRVLTRGEAFDRQIVQRVFTKLRGQEDQLRPLIGTYRPERQGLIDSPMLALLDEYSDVSQFTAARSVLKQKAKELKFYGYTV